MLFFLPRRLIVAFAICQTLKKFPKDWSIPCHGMRGEGLWMRVVSSRIAKENPGWGYDRIVGAMANLGFRLSDQTVANILRRHDIPPAPKRKQSTSWKDFIRAHMAVLAATDFFTVEVLTLRGLMTYYVLFFIHLESRRIYVASTRPWSNAGPSRTGPNFRALPNPSALSPRRF